MGGATLAVGLLLSAAVQAQGLTPLEQRDAHEYSLQEERSRALREQLESRPDVRLQPPGVSESAKLLPEGEAPCFAIERISLAGESARHFDFALSNPASALDDPLGRCLGAEGINLVMERIQNEIIRHGYVTTRVLAAPQDLSTGELQLTVIPGKVRQIRFAADSERRVALRNAIPVAPGDILNLRDIEQGLENLKRAPTADADIRIEPADGPDARPGESDVVIVYRQGFPFRLMLNADDSGSESTGKYQGSVTLSADNLFALNDLLYYSHNQDLGGGESGKRGSDGYAFHYSVPHGHWLFALSASGHDFHQHVAGIAQSYQYSGFSRNAEVRVTRLVYRNAINKTHLHLRGFLRKSSNFIDDTEIEVQRRRTAGWEVGLSQSWFIGQAMLDYQLAYRRGTGAWGALKAPEESSREGTSRLEMLTAELGFVQPFALDAPWGRQAMSYRAQVRAQKNFTPLTPQDRFSIGGRFTVRGFDGQYVLSADNGWLIRNDLTAQLGASGQALYLGLDYGEVGGQSSRWLPGKRLAGAVVGLRGGYRGFGYDVFLGKPLKKPHGFQTDSTTSGFNLHWTF
ncbi:ShlB/FhaC/HecB family hemolysin secretion/activation protein [Pseudothauera nasutitermitis]|uniref:ShlB/FhaC/HecB family hemolysin secretion/activation protein n=1 Tax=Pseudothauera nasutitermitis TaxID=2565930 RepID=A0A4S4B1Z7_9RHOO|nr:ShlB/FhaC/HecB family hemolysin secretion/activation protein [Pseudothauera nasutitermitis]THF66566.1 ShlB/FhaC/HecB family hemolysin secretion/activation protein [Pseudothauera nasutitermitis]